MPGVMMPAAGARSDELARSSFSFHVYKCSVKHDTLKPASFSLLMSDMEYLDIVFVEPAYYPMVRPDIGLISPENAGSLSCRLVRSRHEECKISDSYIYSALRRSSTNPGCDHTSSGIVNSEVPNTQTGKEVSHNKQPDSSKVTDL
jgi:hypothetical protein